MRYFSDYDPSYDSEHGSSLLLLLATCAVCSRSVPHAFIYGETLSASEISDSLLHSCPKPSTIRYKCRFDKTGYALFAKRCLLACYQGLTMRLHVNRAGNSFNLLLQRDAISVGGSIIWTGTASLPSNLESTSQVTRWSSQEMISHTSVSSASRSLVPMIYI